MLILCIFHPRPKDNYEARRLANKPQFFKPFQNQPAGSIYQPADPINQDGQFNQTLFYQNISSYQFTSPDNKSPYESDLVPLNLMYLNFFQDLALTNAKDMIEINEMYVNTFGEIVNGDKFIKVTIIF